MSPAAKRAASAAFVLIGMTLGLGGTAAAATLYSAPAANRISTPCTETQPCRLYYAVGTATAGDDVSLAPGDYYLNPATLSEYVPGYLNLAAGVTLHGDSPASPPAIHGAAPSSLYNAMPLVKLAAGSTVRDVEIDHRVGTGVHYGYALEVAPTSTVERVLARVVAAGTGIYSATACSMLGGTLADTACLGSGSGPVSSVSANSSAAATYALSNVTAVNRSSSGYGVSVGTFDDTVGMSATNLIAAGPTADLAAQATSAAGAVTITIDHSNWKTATTAGAGSVSTVAGAGNQTGPSFAEPAFADAAAGDFHEAFGSPTIGAGTIAPASGSMALGGDPRTIDGSTDIGAYQAYPPPIVTTGQAGSVTDASATLGAVIDPRGQTASASFQYGTGGAYAKTAKLPDLPAGSGQTPVESTITGLAPSTTYHYRIRAQSARGGPAVGLDRTFTTSARTEAPGPGPGPSGPGTNIRQAPILTGLRIAKRWRTHRRGKGGRGGRGHRRGEGGRVGTRIRFKLSEPAAVKLSFSRRVRKRRGHRAGSGDGKRRGPGHGASRRRAGWKKAGSLSERGRAGRNRLRFRGRLPGRRRPLRPGRYRLRAVATDGDGDRSRPRTVGFRILR